MTQKEAMALFESHYTWLDYVMVTLCPHLRETDKSLANVEQLSGKAEYEVKKYFNRMSDKDKAKLTSVYGAFKKGKRALSFRDRKFLAIRAENGSMEPFRFNKIGLQKGEEPWNLVGLSEIAYQTQVSRLLREFWRILEQKKVFQPKPTLA